MDSLDQELSKNINFFETAIHLMKQKIFWSLATLSFNSHFSSRKVNVFKPYCFLLLFVWICGLPDCVLKMISRHEIFSIHVKNFQSNLKIFYLFFSNVINDHTGDGNSKCLFEDRSWSNPKWWFFVTICLNLWTSWLCPENYFEARNFFNPCQKFSK